MSWSTVSRAVVLAVLTLGLLASAVAPAQAHASLVSTEPADGSVVPDSPAEVDLRFDEPVSLVTDSTVLYDATGAVVPSTASVDEATVRVAPDRRLGNGTFVLLYRVVSDDAHPVAGTLRFSVGHPSENVAAPRLPASAPAVAGAQGVLNGLLYLGLLVGAGLVFFAAVLLPGDPTLADVRRRVVTVAQGAGLLAVLAATLRIPVAGLYRSGGSLGEAFTAAAWAPWGTADGAVVVLLCGGLAIAAVAPTMEGSDRARAAFGCLGAAVAVTAPVLTGHTRAYGPTAVVMASDAVHLLAGGVWVGGLVGVALSLSATAGREELVAEAVARFSSVAAFAVATLAGAGAVLALCIVGSWSDLVATRYGALLLVKVGIVVAVVAVAAWNRRRLLPSVTGDVELGRRREAGARLRTAVRLEVLGLVAVLAITGFLVDQVPRVT